MRGIPFFLVAALVPLGQTQPTWPNPTGLKTILHCMDNPASNVAEQAFVGHWKEVILKWNQRDARPPESLSGLMEFMNHCAARYPDDPSIGSITTKPWKKFWEDLVNLAATFRCVKRKASGPQVDEKCMADLEKQFKQKPRVLTKTELNTFHKHFCQKQDEYLILAYRNQCAARTIQDVVDTYPDDPVEVTTESQPNPAPAPVQHSPPSQESSNNGNGKVHHPERVQMTTYPERKDTGPFFSKFSSFLNRIGGALPKSNGYTPTPVFRQAPVKPILLP